MERVIQNMMQWFDISEERFFQEQEILTPMGMTLYWEYYQYVKNNPIEKWNTPTAILCSKKDDLCEYEFTASFSERFNCKIEVSDSTEHYFHTEEDMRIYRDWIRVNIMK